MQAPPLTRDRCDDHRIPHTRRHDELVDTDRVGPFDHLAVDEVLARFALLPIWASTTDPRKRYQIDGARTILEWLHTFPGDGWQRRWVAAGADDGTEWITGLVAVDGSDLSNARKRERLLRGVAGLLQCRIVLPGYRFLYSYKANALFEQCGQAFRPDLFAKIDAAAESLAIPRKQRAEAVKTITKMVVHTGRDVDELTADDVLGLRSWCLRERGGTGVGLAWVLPRGIADLGPCATLQEAVRIGQRPTTEIVDQYQLRDSDIRTLLVRYLDERRPALDHNSFRNLIAVLVGVFWADIERHHPDLKTLDLPPEVAEAWKQRARVFTGADGARRERSSLGYFQVLARVRAFYLDIQEWAMEDPTCSRWAAPSPVRRGDTDGCRKAHRQVTANMHQRVRDRLPQLPTLVQTVDEHRADQATLLSIATATPIEAAFTHRSRGFRRIAPCSYQRPEYRGMTPAVLVQDLATGETINLTDTEDEAFRTWAIVETLRHNGIRVEELTELTHLALISYKLPDTGEIVPMLQIVPSKTNEERLLLVGPEPASVLATTITRLRKQNSGTVPLTRRYDHYERTTGPALPHLFQRRRGTWRWTVIGPTTVRKLLIAALDRCDLRDAARTAAALYRPRLPKDVRHRGRRGRASRAHPRPTPRPRQHQHHPGLHRHLHRRPRSHPPRVPRQAPRATTRGRIPRTHRAGMARLPATLLRTQTRTRRMRTPLRNQLHTRTQLHPVPEPAARPDRPATARRDHRQPPRPDQRSTNERLARRSARTADKHRRRRRQTRQSRPPPRPPHSGPGCTRNPRHHKHVKP